MDIVVRRDSLLGRVASRFEKQRAASPLSLQQWIEQFTFSGVQYQFVPSMAYPGEKQEPPEASFNGYVSAAYKQNGVIFACLETRRLLFSEARFQYRRLRSGRPGELWGNSELQVLEQPWPSGTTGDLLSRMEQDASLAGNAYIYREGSRLKRLRPDWVAILLGSQYDLDPENTGELDVLGYAYYPGGVHSGNDPVPLLPQDVAHYAPIPDPCARFRGMSWLTPIITELMADQAATTHKLKFFENGATPNFAIKYDPNVVKDNLGWQRWVEMYEQRFGEATANAYMNAYKTLHLGLGADIVPVGTDLRQLEFKITQGAGETRICAAARVPPVVVGVSEGLQAATYSNYGQARRHFADGTLRPLWRNAAGSLATIMNVPADSELWYDDRDIPFLAEDVKDAAEAQQKDAQTLRTLVEAGWEPDASIDAVIAGDLARLKGKHTGLTSVQLQPPGTASSNGSGDPSSVPQPA
jgi:phage portal protein BeeE